MNPITVGFHLEETSYKLMTKHRFKTDIKNQGLKVSFLAEKVGISQPLLSMYLNGTRKMPTDIEFKLARELA